MTPRSPIQDIDHKLDIMDHVNQDHTEEVLAIAQSHCKEATIASAKIKDVFQEGVLLELVATDNKSAQEIFAPFEIEGSLEDKILYLAYAAIVKQGRDFSGTGKRFFEVIDKQSITKNMLRITLQSAVPLPEYYPGYAFAFVLKSLQKRPEQSIKQGAQKSWRKNLFDRAFIWLMKHLSSKHRQTLLMSANKDVRLYTLRKSWKSSGASFVDQGYVDIFTHGDTPGSLWARQLRIGDIISSRSEAKDKHPHLSTGETVLIADETAYPALAGILEQWQNPIAPHIILLSCEKDEQAYFDTDFFPSAAHVHRIVCSPEKQGDEVLAVLKEIEKIDAVWGAFESESAKNVRRFLRNERQVMGKNNHTKTYWMLKSKHSSTEE